MNVSAVLALIASSTLCNFKNQEAALGFARAGAQTAIFLTNRIQASNDITFMWVLSLANVPGLEPIG